MEQTKDVTRIKKVNMVFLVSMILSVTVSFLPLDFIAARPVLQIIFSQAILVLPSVIYMVRFRLPFSETVGLKKLRFGDILLCILFAVLIQPLMTLLNAVSMSFAVNTTGTFILELTEKVSFLPALFLMAFLPCFLEETVYRGVFYREYRKISLWKAALLSGFLFGLAHGNINQFTYAMVMGVLFALLNTATGSLLSSMLVHFWINAGSVVMVYLYPKLYEFAQAFYRMYKEYGNEEMATMLEQTLGDMTMSSKEWMKQMIEASANMELPIGTVLRLYAPQAVVMSVAAFLVFKKLAKRNGTWNEICSAFMKKAADASEAVPEETVKKERLVTLSLSAAILIGIAFMIFYEIVIRMT